MAQTDFSFSACFVAATFSRSFACAFGCEDCGQLICPSLEPPSAIAAIDPIDYRPMYHAFRQEMQFEALRVHSPHRLTELAPHLVEIEPHSFLCDYPSRN
jgi:hypothetical protein